MLRLRRGYADTSQKGNLMNFRNETLNGAPFTWNGACVAAPPRPTARPPAHPPVSPEITVRAGILCPLLRPLSHQDPPQSISRPKQIARSPPPPPRARPSESVPQAPVLVATAAAAAAGRSRPAAWQRPYSRRRRPRLERRAGGQVDDTAQGGESVNHCFGNRSSL